MKHQLLYLLIYGLWLVFMQSRLTTCKKKGAKIVLAHLQAIKGPSGNEKGTQSSKYNE